MGKDNIEKEPVANWNECLTTSLVRPIKKDVKDLSGLEVRVNDHALNASLLRSVTKKPTIEPKCETNAKITTDGKAQNGKDKK